MICKPVLIVEDEEDIRENMVMLLEDEGYVVYSASNGLEALMILNDTNRVRPGMVALDFYMPLMDARSFLAAIESERRNQKFLELPIILVTAADAKAQAGLGASTQGVLRKPIDIEAFLKVVGQYCGQPALAQ